MGSRSVRLVADTNPPAPASDPAVSTVALAAPFVVAALTVITYANAWSNAIVHDDRFFYPSRARLDLGSIERLFGQDVWWAATGSSGGGLYRPLLMVSLTIDTALFGGGALGAHVMNVVFHVLATLGVYGLALALVRGSGRGGSADATTAALAAAGAAAVFGVHPIHTEAVDSIFNRSEIQATLCVLAALAAVWVWEARRPALAWSVAGVLYLAGLLFRESAVAFPALAMVLLLLLRPGLSFRRLAPAGVLVLPLGIYLALRHAALAAVPPTGTPSLSEYPPPSGLVEQLGYSLASLREYVRMVVWPHPLRLSYEDFVGSGVPVAVTVHAALLGLAAYSRRRMPLLAAGIVFFYVALVPTTRLLTAPGVELKLGSYVLLRPDPGVTPLSERAAYLPSVGLALSLAFGLAALTRRYGPYAGLAPALGLVLVLAPLTDARNLQWRSSRAMITAEVEAAPQNGDAWRMYVGVLADEGRQRDAVEVCDRQAAAHPRTAQLQNSCGSAYVEVGRFDDGVTAYRRAIDAGLTSIGHANLGRAYGRMGRPADAEREFELAAQAEVDPAARHYRQGQLIERFHPERMAEAAEEYRKAIELRSGYVAAREALRRVGGR